LRAGGDLSQVLKEDDLVSLRDAFRELERAVHVSDLASVEAATFNLRNLLAQVGVADSVATQDLSFLRDLDASSGDLSALLESRLRAFKIAIAAWQGPDPGRLK